MNPLLQAGIAGAIGFVLFSLLWICWLVEKFGTPLEAVSLDIYREALFHNPLFWMLALLSALLFALAERATLHSHP